MRARIALHAGIPILNLGLDYYADWNSIVIYPGDFRVHDEYMDEHGVVHREIMDLCGQSLSQGPIVLSWEAMREEDETPADHDLVIHECAHKLDRAQRRCQRISPHACGHGRARLGARLSCRLPTIMLGTGRAKRQSHRSLRGRGSGGIFCRFERNFLYRPASRLRKSSGRV